MSPPSTRPQVLAALPGTVHEIVARTNLVESTIRRHLCALRADGEAHVQRRKRTSGHPSPVWTLGPGPDAPPLAPRTSAEWCRKHRRRIKRAIEKAATGGKENGRYLRHISLNKAKETALRTRQEPQSWASALFAVAGQGRQHAN